MNSFIENLENSKKSEIEDMLCIRKLSMVSVNGNSSENKNLLEHKKTQQGEKKHILYGFLFSYGIRDYSLNKESGTVIILNETTDHKKILSCSCNGVIKETDITDKENEFIEDLIKADILNWKKVYDSGFDWMKTWHMTWSLDVSLDQEHIISSGYDYSYPEEMETLKAILRKYGMSIIGGKNKKTKV